MPGTVNGIGTSYLGKKNLERHLGVCDKCRKTVQLQTYETRLWVVVLFIPVIPLGRKMVLDYCPACTWHRFVSLDEWERIREKAIAESLAKTRQKPDDPETACELMGTLIAFNQHAEAAEMAKVLEAQFSDHASVLLGLADYYDTVADDPSRADDLVMRALTLDPENEDVRVAAGITFIRKGETARARELLSFMETRGPGQSPPVMMMLARGFQEQGKHREAMQILSVIARDFPDVARDRGFRKAVKLSEQVLGPDRTTPRVALPPSHTKRKLAIVGAVLAALVVGGWFLTNQTLHVVNGLLADASISIDGAEAGTYPAGERTEVTLRPGVHEAVITTAAGDEETVTLDMRLGWWDRMFDKPVFVLNPRGTATVLQIGVMYSEKHFPGDEKPRLEFHFGKSFMVLRDIDYGFDDLPEEVELSHAGERVLKTRLTPLFADPDQMLILIGEEKGKGEQLKYAESQVNARPRSWAMVANYLTLCDEPRLKQRAADFLAKGLDARPVQVRRHQGYQTVRLKMGGEDALKAEYDALVAREPANATLLYLRSRLEATCEARDALLERAVRADASDPWPHWSRGGTYMAQGAYAEALEHIRKAHELSADKDLFDSSLFDARLAFGDTDALEKELRAQLAEDPFNFASHARLLVVLAGTGRADDARRASTEYANAFRQEYETDEVSLVYLSQLLSDYFVNDLGSAVGRCQKLMDFMDVTPMMFLITLEAEGPETAASLHEELGDWGASRRALLMACAAISRDERYEAETWQQNAVRLLRAEGAESPAMADLLARGDGVTLAEVNRISIDTDTKAPFLVLLAHQSPSTRDELLALAGKLNVGPRCPHRLLANAIERLRR